MFTVSPNITHKIFGPHNTVNVNNCKSVPKGFIGFLFHQPPLADEHLNIDGYQADFRGIINYLARDVSNIKVSIAKSFHLFQVVLDRCRVFKITT